RLGSPLFHGHRRRDLSRRTPARRAEDTLGLRGLLRVDAFPRRIPCSRVECRSSLPGHRMGFRIGSSPLRIARRLRHPGDRRESPTLDHFGCEVMPMGVLLAFALLALPGADDAATQVLDAPKFGVKVSLPKSWEVAVRERGEYVFVAKIPQADPEKPGA